MIEAAPRVIVAGIGCTSRATADEIVGLILATLAEAGRSSQSLACLASLDSRTGAAPLRLAARRLAVPLHGFTPAELAAEDQRLATPSELVAGLLGAAGIAEAAALKAGTLLMPKRKSGNVTCALGLASAALDLQHFGREAS